MNLPRQIDFMEEGLLLQMFEIKELLLRKKVVKFHAQGFCMYPCICPGDLLHIEFRDIQDIVVGDVAVFRRQGRLFGHRVIAAWPKEVVPYIVTRPDTVIKDEDAPVFGADVLGVVVALERGGKVLDVSRRCYVGIERVWIGLGYRWCVLCAVVWGFMISRVRSWHTQGWYRFLASRLFAGVPVSFSVTAPLGKDGSGVFWRKITCSEIGSDVSSWRLMVKVGGCAAGYVAFNRRADQWCVDEVCLRLRYRSTRVEERVWQKVKEIRESLDLTRT